MKGSAVTEKGSKIPTPEELDRASRIMEERARNLDLVRDSLLEHFRPRCPLHDVVILDQRDVDFRAYIFVRRATDLRIMKKAGVDREIVDFVYTALERYGRGRRDEIRVAFEFDSDERVQAEFNGDYFLRLR